MREINLGELTRSGEHRILVGEDLGVSARRLFALDDQDHAGEPLRVIVPPEINILTTSFFRGMFAGSVRALENDPERFLERYRFAAGPLMMRQIVLGIEAVSGRRLDPVVH